MSESLEVENLLCRRGGRMILEELSFTLGKGEIACLLGPSGSGKTTLLRCLSGLEKPEGGVIRLKGKVLSRQNDIFMDPEFRNIGMVFQESSLFPHLSLKENMIFGLQKRQKSLHQLGEMSRVLEIAALLDRYPHEVSGGQRQRAALGRALLRSPDLLLMDEPFSHLDSRIKKELLESVSVLLRKLKITTLMVTHSREDAFDFSDTVGVLLDRNLSHWGSPESLYYRPSTRNTALFMGIACLVRSWSRDGIVYTPLGVLESKIPEITGDCDALIFPEQVTCVKGETTNASVLACLFRGTHYLYTIGLSAGGTLCSFVPSQGHTPIRAGEKVMVSLNMKHAYVYPVDK